ncbi:hypothetical protein FNV43_RR03275 [Rhamnella rubrinervis]|uniref:Probable small nuclear ribonucleoprotein E n=1 Tax=Rhamnella rubrinervis TaxID=2594499 RepID=A0A8K0MNR0_9ROSA|nr:hypothetical protein FNV43_RR03275 [Rhamnella rubrinervis]
MASTKVQRIMTQPINLIFRFLQSKARIQIWLFEQKDLRIEGRIIGFDEYMNLVLDDAEEVNVKKKSKKSLGGKDTSERRQHNSDDEHVRENDDFACNGLTGIILLFQLHGGRAILIYCLLFIPKLNYAPPVCIWECFSRINFPKLLPLLFFHAALPELISEGGTDFSVIETSHKGKDVRLKATDEKNTEPPGGLGLESLDLRRAFVEVGRANGSRSWCTRVLCWAICAMCLPMGKQSAPFPFVTDSDSSSTRIISNYPFLSSLFLSLKILQNARSFLVFGALPCCFFG